MSPDPVLAEYDRLAGEYDRRWGDYVTASVRATLRRLEVRPGARVLDVGCGTGTLLTALVRAVPGVMCVGVDLSARMLAVARRKLPPAVALVAGTAERLPFADASFTAVVSTSALHYFRDPAAALREMGRVLAPGGSVVITDWCDDYLACRLCGLALRALRRPGSRVYGGGECRRMLAAAGFRALPLERYRINWLWGLMTAVGVRENLPVLMS
jgi:ubiquinone/menaquinone biosynthesis C-methylase UbiE